LSITLPHNASIQSSIKKIILLEHHLEIQGS
jgi:hypothetical protein